MQKAFACPEVLPAFSIGRIMAISLNKRLITNTRRLLIHFMLHYNKATVKNN